MRVAVFGSSVALFVRPPRGERAHGTYIDLLRRELERREPGSEVANLAYRSRMVTHETDIGFTASLARIDPDVAILHYGVNEAAPRALPYSMWMWLYGPQRCSRIKRYAACRLLPLLAFVTRAFHMSGWVDPVTFGKHLSSLIRHCRKESAAVVFVVNIGPPNERFIRMLPGIDAACVRYNSVIAECASAEGAFLLDAYSLIDRAGLDKAQPDGAHLSADGHQLLFEELLRQLVDRGLLSATSGGGPLSS